MSLHAILPFGLLVLMTVGASLGVQGLVGYLVLSPGRRRVVLLALTVLAAAAVLVVARLHPLPVPHGAQIELVVLIVALVLPHHPGRARQPSSARRAVLSQEL